MALSLGSLARSPLSDRAQWSDGLLRRAGAAPGSCSPPRPRCDRDDAGSSRRWPIPVGLGGRRAAGPGDRRRGGRCWGCSAWWGWPTHPLAERAHRGARGGRGRSRTWRWCSSRSTRAESCDARWRRRPLRPLDLPRPRRRPLRVVVAHGAAGPVPSARHAARAQRPLRPRAAPPPRRVAHVDARRRTRRSSSTSTAARGPSATSASRAGRCCTSSSRRGWVAVSCNYRLAPRHPWPAQIEDVTRTLAWIKKNIATYGGDPDRVVVVGRLGRRAPGGAGGPDGERPDVAAPRRGAASTDWSVRGAMPFYGVLEMTGDESHWHGLGWGLSHLLEHRVVQLPFAEQRGPLPRPLALRSASTRAPRRSWWCRA